MRISAFAAMTAFVLLIAPAARPAEKDATVPTYHADAARSGHYIVPSLIWTNVANLTRDAAFDGQVPGNVYAQLLYWRPAGAGAGLVIVATEENAVVALESLGLGSVYIGGIRNKPAEVAAELGLPPRVFALFGHAIGHPDPDRPTGVKHRTSVSPGLVERTSSWHEPRWNASSRPHGDRAKPSRS